MIENDLPSGVAWAGDAFLNGPLRENPHRVGHRLTKPPWEGFWTASRAEWRIIYDIDSFELVGPDVATGPVGFVTVVRVRLRADAYQGGPGGT